MPIDLRLRAGFAALMRVLNRKEDVAPVEGEPSSIVLLLQTPDFPTLKQLSTHAERAFHVPFATENLTNYCVFQKVLYTLMQIGPHVLSFMFYTRPYFENDPDFVCNLPKPAQRAACERHNAWLAMNYAKGPGRESIQYALLSRLSIQMLDANCTAAYIPGEQLLIPNDGSLLHALQQNITATGDLKLPKLRPN